MPTTFENLTSAIKTKLEAVSGVNIVRVGTWNPSEMVDEMNAGTNRTRIEFLLTRCDRRYVSARQQDRVYQYVIYGHTWVATADRIDGTDMYSIEALGAGIITGLYGFMDDPTPPVTGFLSTNDGATMIPLYQEFDEHLNSVTVEIGFTVGVNDTVS